MIHFDTTKASRSAHQSGLQRVSARLLQALGKEARGVAWDSLAGGAIPPREDWFLTPELFDEEERPGFSAFLKALPCRKAAVFHDAIPLKHPDWTWPKSVARHPGYMAALADFDLILAVSEASRDELAGYWRWMGLQKTPDIAVLRLGADFDGTPRASAPAGVGRAQARPALLCVGILEPRKNQVFLAECCAKLWERGAGPDLHLAGRTNPHFGPPLEKRLRTLARAHPRRLRLHGALGDKALADLFAQCDAAAMPTLAEGCGLPPLEALWRGKPVLCSDIPPLRETAAGGGCLLLPASDTDAWCAALTQLCEDPKLLPELTAQACCRPLPSWAETGAAVLALLDR